MTKVKFFSAALMMTTFAGTAYAQDSGAYGALGVTTYEFDNYGVDAKLGYNFNRYFGVEAQGVIGVTTDSYPTYDSPDAATVKSKVKHTVGAFAVARLPLSEQFEVFGRAGIHNTRRNIQINNALSSNYNIDGTSFALGGGLQYKLSEKSALRAEYTYLDKVGGDTVSLGFVRKF